MHEFHMCSTPDSFYLMLFLEGLYVCLSPACFSITVTGKLEGARTPYVFRYIFLLSNLVTCRVYLHYLVIMPLTAFSLRTTGLFDIQDLHFVYSNLKPVT